jgi:UDP-N-acetylmuramoyl-tripeptide--D-alanyl-D-alanine ligase
MGANHQGEIHNLCTIADPDFGLITNIGKAHLEGFGGIEGVKKGKSELYRFISKKGGFIFCNKSDLVLSQLLPSEANCIEYFDDAILNGKAEFLNFEYKNTQFSTHLFGGHNLSNALVAIEIGIYFGVDLGLIATSINKYIPENNRSQKTTVNDKIVIKDSYNSNPSSLRASLGSLIKSYDSKQVVLILGDMLELGEYSLIEHHAILGYIQEYHFLDVWLIGEEFSQLANKYDYNFFLTTAEAKKFFSLDNYPPNSIIFLKGSRGIAVEKLLNV